MASGEFGESSRKVDQNDPERPLKKARYVWEVKGKYHLKEAYKNNENNKNSEGTKHATSSIRDHIRVRQENLDIVDESDNNNVLVNNNEEECCKEAILARAEETLNECMSSGECSDNDSSDDEERTSSDTVPVTMLPSKQKSHDYYLSAWQAKHIARGFVDNTINRVIESHGLDHMDRWRVCEVFPEFTDHTPDVKVEDEGITMAIQSHGLQTQDAFSGTYQRSNYHPDHMSDTEENQPLAANGGNSVVELVNTMVDSSSNCDSVDTMNCDSLENQDQDDFMNAAVSVAIQSKGLSSSYS